MRNIRYLCLKESLNVNKYMGRNVGEENTIAILAQLILHKLTLTCIYKLAFKNPYNQNLINFEIWREKRSLRINTSIFVIIK